MDNVLNKMIEIELVSSYSKLYETLTRFGIANRKDKVLTQSVHLFKHNGKLYLCHFKQLFEFNGKKSNIEQVDINRLHMIALLMEQYNLIKFVNPKQKEYALQPCVDSVNLASIPKSFLKDGWVLKAKYNFAKK